ncbi:hypothetical protein SDC9_50577 [bioreactor metagenome]|uniref:Uncharacterized protein n=1 Tax=bioreactor metagenome TaxID=1076179 RepID=A0A644WL64_9ZZZZ
MDELLYDQLIDIPESLASKSSLLDATFLSSCSDWCSETCGTTSESGCDCNAEGCLTCQSECQISCQWVCEGACQDCQTTCEISSQNPSGGASLSLAGGPYIITWTISGLSKSFTTGNGYVRAGITSNQFTVGGVSSITGIVDYKSATSSGSTTVSQSTSLDPGTYTFWGFVQTAAGGYWPAGTATVTVSSDTFNWTYAGINVSTGSLVAGSTKISGLGVYVSASEWNSLVSKVNSKLGTSLSTVSSGQPISAARVNPVASALGVSVVSSGTTIRASFFNNLRTAYNNL